MPQCKKESDSFTFLVDVDRCAPYIAPTFGSGSEPCCSDAGAEREYRPRFTAKITVNNRLSRIYRIQALRVGEDHLIADVA
jgi:hypothetical protein